MYYNLNDLSSLQHIQYILSVCINELGFNKKRKFIDVINIINMHDYINNVLSISSYDVYNVIRILYLMINTLPSEILLEDVIYNIEMDISNLK
jgi:hypothetical protein